MSQNGFAEHKWTLLAIVMLVASLGVLLATLIETTELDGPLGQRPIDGLPVGEEAPPITAQGWVNGTAPTAEELAGQVYVVEIWATWCYPCKLQAPHLVAVQKHFKDRVRFIGLTAQSPKNNPQLLKEIDQFLTDSGITWTNGYGALDTVNAFKCNLIPEMWVVGRDGKIVWNHNTEGLSLVDGIELALNAPKPSEAKAKTKPDHPELKPVKRKPAKAEKIETEKPLD